MFSHVRGGYPHKVTHLSLVQIIPPTWQYVNPDADNQVDLRDLQVMWSRLNVQNSNSQQIFQTRRK